jgi:hypothetical protein|tara:strand:+ start:7453 stop:7611 length:159 start_codon:yes stop_codon:yes gene_type:complete
MVKRKLKPKKITTTEANRLEDYAQSLEDEVTHTVDYGDLGEEQTQGEDDKDA